MNTGVAGAAGVVGGGGRDAKAHLARLRSASVKSLPPQMLQDGTITGVIKEI